MGVGSCSLVIPGGESWVSSVLSSPELLFIRIETMVKVSSKQRKGVSLGVPSSNPVFKSLALLVLVFLFTGKEAL